MGPFDPPQKPTNPLGWHRTLSPTAAVKVSPICFGGISLGHAWSELFGKNEDSFTLLDAFYEQGGNFIDTANTYNQGQSETLLGEWMEKRGNRDEMVIATKYTSGYKKHEPSIKLQTNYAGNNAKSLHLSIRDSLNKLRTTYIDILYVHWWDFTTSPEEIMRQLHSYVLSHQILYLGASDLPAWVVVKCNAFARHHGLTPFSVYQGRWNAAYRDLEAEIIPMCESEGLAVVSWASLGGGQLQPSTQREHAAAAAAEASNPSHPPGPPITTRPAVYSQSPASQAVCSAIEIIATDRATTFQAIVLAYLYAQSTHVFPIVGVQTLAHVRALPDALRLDPPLTSTEIDSIQRADKTWKPQFPADFHYEWDQASAQRYSTALRPCDVQQYQMWAWFDAPRRRGGFDAHPEC
jgi:aryl-alcohol dehydrogenase-like predicted oxidoreductase